MMKTSLRVPGPVTYCYLVILLPQFFSFYAFRCTVSRWQTTIKYYFNTYIRTYEHFRLHMDQCYCYTVNSISLIAHKENQSDRLELTSTSIPRTHLAVAAVVGEAAVAVVAAVMVAVREKSAGLKTRLTTTCLPQRHLL